MRCVATRGPKHTYSTIFLSHAQVAQEYNGKVKFVKIDTDIHEEIASSLKVCFVFAQLS